MPRKSQFVKISREEWDRIMWAMAALASNAPLAMAKLDEIAETFRGKSETMRKGYLGRVEDVRDAHGVIGDFIKAHAED